MTETLSAHFKSLFFGTPEFALPSLEATFKNTELMGVITQPDKPRGRGLKLQACPVKEWALKNNLKVFSPPSLKKESKTLLDLKNFILDTKADIFIVAAYGNILTQEFLDYPRLGAVNVHASLLPKWRGAAPIQRSLEAGDKITGITLQKMQLELDAGDVLIKKECPISDEMDAVSLGKKLSDLGYEALIELFKDLNRTSELVGIPQDTALISFAPKIKKEEGEWNPSLSAVEIHNKVRAFKAWPGFKARISGGTEAIKILETELMPADKNLGEALEAGEILLKDTKTWLGSAKLRSGEHLGLCVKKIQIPAKGPVAAFDYFQNLAKKNPERLKFK